MSLLCRELDKLWNENKGDVILFTWSQFLKEETLTILKLSDTLDLDTLKPRKGVIIRQSSDSNGGSSNGASGYSSCGSKSLKDGDLTLEKLNISENSNLKQSSYCNTPDATQVHPSVSTGGSCASSAVDPKLGNCDNRISSASGNCISERKSSQDLSGSSVRRSDSFRTLNANSSLWDDRAIQDVGPLTNFFILLRDYDKDIRQTEFNLKNFECDVCFISKAGKNCIEFWPCGHVYCKECMKGYFEVQINEGNVKALVCPTDKCSSSANPKQVLF